MVAKQHIPKPYTSEQLRLLATRLEQWSSLLKNAADQSESLSDGTIYAFNSSSLEKGQDSLTAFMGELDKSLGQLLAGNPITSETRKTRTRKEALSKLTPEKQASANKMRARSSSKDSDND